MHFLFLLLLQDKHRLGRARGFLFVCFFVFFNQILIFGVLILIHNILRPKYLSYFSFIISALLNLAFRPGSVIVYFILYFKTAVTPEKGIENLRVAVSSNGTFGNFQAKNLVLMSEESTKSTTTAGIKGLRILPIKVIGLHDSSRFHSTSLAFSLSFLPSLADFPSTSFCHNFSQKFF